MNKKNTYIAFESF